MCALSNFFEYSNTGVYIVFSYLNESELTINRKKGQHQSEQKIIIIIRRKPYDESNILDIRFVLIFNLAPALRTSLKFQKPVSHLFKNISFWVFWCCFNEKLPNCGSSPPSSFGQTNIHTQRTSNNYNKINLMLVHCDGSNDQIQKSIEFWIKTVNKKTTKESSIITYRQVNVDFREWKKKIRARKKCHMWNGNQRGKHSY